MLWPTLRRCSSQVNGSFDRIGSRRTADWWLQATTFGLVIIVTICLRRNALLGGGLREAIDPRLKR